MTEFVCSNLPMFLTNCEHAGNLEKSHNQGIQYFATEDEARTFIQDMINWAYESQQSRLAYLMQITNFLTYSKRYQLHEFFWQN